MKRLLCALALSLACLGPTQAQDTTMGQITVSTPWARATPGRSPNGAGYFELHNKGMADRLIAASSDVSERTELHTHLSENGVMRMRKLDSVELPHGGMVHFRPHGNHVMFIGLMAPLKEGQTVHLTLTFEKAGDVAVEMPVMPIGHKGAMSHGKMDMKHGDGMKKDGEMKMDKHKGMKSE